MDLDKYYETHGRLQQIDDIKKLQMEVYRFYEKFSKPINLGLFHHLPDDIKIKLRNVCDEITEDLEALIKIENDKIRKI